MADTKNDELLDLRLEATQDLQSAADANNTSSKATEFYTAAIAKLDKIKSIDPTWYTQDIDSQIKKAKDAIDNLAKAQQTAATPAQASPAPKPAPVVNDQLADLRLEVTQDFQSAADANKTSSQATDIYTAAIAKLNKIKSIDPTWYAQDIDSQIKRAKDAIDSLAKAQQPAATPAPAPIATATPVPAPAPAAVTATPAPEQKPVIVKQAEVPPQKPVAAQVASVDKKTEDKKPAGTTKPHHPKPHHPHHPKADHDAKAVHEPAKEAPASQPHSEHEKPFIQRAAKTFFINEPQKVAATIGHFLTGKLGVKDEGHVEEATKPHVSDGKQSVAAKSA